MYPYRCHICATIWKFGGNMMLEDGFDMTASCSVASSMCEAPKIQKLPYKSK